MSFFVHNVQMSLSQNYPFHYLAEFSLDGALMLFELLVIFVHFNCFILFDLITIPLCSLAVIYYCVSIYIFTGLLYFCYSNGCRHVTVKSTAQPLTGASFTLVCNLFFGSRSRENGELFPSFGKKTSESSPLQIQSPTGASVVCQKVFATTAATAPNQVNGVVSKGPTPQRLRWRARPRCCEKNHVPSSLVG